MTFMALLSKYLETLFARNFEDAGASSEGFRTTAFPADIAPINGSKDSPT